LIPADVEFLSFVPLTPSGKIDVARLPSPRVSLCREAFVAPGTELEQRLAEIWEESLQVERVGLHDDFFSLRGNSLLATRVIARICDLVQLDLPLACLFESPTVAGLAQSIEALRWMQDPQSNSDEGEREVVRL